MLPVECRWTLSWVALIAFVTAPMALAEGDSSADHINRRLYERLDGPSTSEPIQTVSGQLYIAKEHLESGVISDALEAMLDAGQASSETVAVRHAARLNFEIHFQKNSSELTDESRAGLDELGEVLSRDYLDMRFIVGGHTDLDGNNAVNGPLSQARAESARDYLVEKFQLNSERLVAKGFGTGDPLREVEESAQDKLYNRRVDLRPIRDDR